MSERSLEFSSCLDRVSFAKVAAIIRFSSIKLMSMKALSLNISRINLAEECQSLHRYNNLTRESQPMEFEG